jgi:thiosulfate dehydrogenase
MREFLLGALTAPVALAVIALGGARLGVVPVTAAAEPTALEGWLAGVAVDATVARDAPHLSNPVPPTDENLRAGLRVYRNNCEGCHGGADRKPSPFGTSFYPRAPQFPLRPPRRPDWQLHYVVQNGLRRTGMPGWRSTLNDEQIWRAVTFVSHLDSLPPSVASAWREK